MKNKSFIKMLLCGFLCSAYINISFADPFNIHTRTDTKSTNKSQQSSNSNTNSSQKQHNQQQNNDINDLIDCDNLQNTDIYSDKNKEPDANYDEYNTDEDNQDESNENEYSMYEGNEDEDSEPEGSENEESESDNQQETPDMYRNIQNNNFDEVIKNITKNNIKFLKSNLRALFYNTKTTKDKQNKYIDNICTQYPQDKTPINAQTTKNIFLLSALLPEYHEQNNPNETTIYNAILHYYYALGKIQDYQNTYLYKHLDDLTNDYK